MKKFYFKTRNGKDIEDPATISEILAKSKAEDVLVTTFNDELPWTWLSDYQQQAEKSLKKGKDP